MQNNRPRIHLLWLAAALVWPAPVAFAQSQELRNTVTLTADVAREDVRPVTGSSHQSGQILLDLEYARSLWRTLELTFAGSLRGVRTEEGGVAATQAFHAYQLGARQYLRDPQRQGWTPYLDASLGEGWLTRRGSASGETTQRFYGYEVSAGAALHVSPQADFRVSLNYDRYLAYEKTPTDRDTFSRLGLRLGAAYRF